MNVKVENKPVLSSRRQGRPDFRVFLDTLKKLEKGQSFLWPINNDNRRMLTIAGRVLDRKFATAKEGDTFRVGRVL